ncbi:hypothetical protein DH2020_034455 [Rehmannia glutinosa]|uniref:F-box domain-containing protein n=1 Tax=Rehmannia glutinosa TaxID=99300 RepID=A0ABR0VA75_REHGL
MMEQKHVFLSALSVGVGVGVGLGLVSGSTVGRWTGGTSFAAVDAISAEQLELEILRLVVDGKESRVTFEDFPYYLSERTRVLLTSAAYVHLKHLDVSKHTRNLSPASRAILLSGPAELYQQMLAKALAHHFEAKLILLDINDFSLKMQSKHGIIKKDSSVKRSISESTLQRMSSFFGSFSMLPYKDDNRGTLSGQRSGLDAAVRDTEGVNTSLRPRRISSVSSDMSSISGLQSSSNPAPSKRVCSWSFDEKLLVQSLYKVLVSVSQTSCIILYIRDVDKVSLHSSRLYKLFDRMLKKLTGSVLVLGSRMLDLAEDSVEVDDRLNLLFPYNIEVRPPEDETRLVNWKSQLEEDMRKIQFQDRKTILLSLSHGLSIFQEGKSCGKDTLKMETNAECFKDTDGKENAGAKPESKSENPKSENKTEAEKSNSQQRQMEVLPDNEFEKRIRPEVIPANEIGVTFSDIGALDEIKESLQELVMLPLRRPDLFTGGLLKPCRGILLFGPPDEVDSMLGQRTRVGEHEAMRKIKNEFMTHWDGLLTKPGERILVLAATNRPFDLDEAIIRRFERRIMVGLPSVENREMILRTLLSKENVENLDFKELAVMTEGYSGSDLKNICVTAAYRPVRELIQQERQKDKKKKQREEEGESSEDASATSEETKGEKVISLRPLSMEDMRQAKNQVAASFASEGSIMGELKQWNELYGEGGSRKKEHGIRTRILNQNILFPNAIVRHQSTRIRSYSGKEERKRENEGEKKNNLGEDRKTQSAISAANSLLQSAEFAFPKQKRALAVTEYKHAVVASLTLLPQDVLVHIFSFLDVQSLVSASAVCRPWYTAARDNHLWKSLYATFFYKSDNFTKHSGFKMHGMTKNDDKIHPLDDIGNGVGFDWRCAFKTAFKETCYRKFKTYRGYCLSCCAIVWLSSNKCSNELSTKEGINHQIMPISTQQIVDYVLYGGLLSESSSDSDSDTEDVSVFKLWAYPRQIGQ